MGVISQYTTICITLFAGLASSHGMTDPDDIGDVTCLMQVRVELKSKSKLRVGTMQDLLVHQDVDHSATAVHPESLPDTLDSGLVLLQEGATDATKHIVQPAREADRQMSPELDFPFARDREEDVNGRGANELASAALLRRTGDAQESPRDSELEPSAAEVVPDLEPSGDKEFKLHLIDTKNPASAGGTLNVLSPVPAAAQAVIAEVTSFSALFDGVSKLESDGTVAEDPRDLLQRRKGSRLHADFLRHWKTNLWLISQLAAKAALFCLAIILTLNRFNWLRRLMHRVRLSLFIRKQGRLDEKSVQVIGEAFLDLEIPGLQSLTAADLLEVEGEIPSLDPLVPAVTPFEIEEARSPSEALPSTAWRTPAWVWEWTSAPNSADASERNSEGGAPPSQEPTDGIQRLMLEWQVAVDTGISAYMHQHPDRFYQLSRRGIPSEFRWQIWQAAVRYCKQEDLQAYDVLCQTENRWSALIRANATTPLFKGPLLTEDALYRILNAYANFNHDVGYCEGLNFISSFLLHVSGDEEGTFGVFVCLMDQIGLRGFYEEGQPLFRIYASAWEHLMKEQFPRLQEHFEKVGLQSRAYLHQWLTTLFSSSLPLPVAMSVWDAIFCNGLPVILSVAAAVLHVLESSLLTMPRATIVECLTQIKAHEGEERTRIGEMIMKHLEDYKLPKHIQEHLPASQHMLPWGSI